VPIYVPNSAVSKPVPCSDSVCYASLNYSQRTGSNVTPVRTYNTIVFHARQRTLSSNVALSRSPNSILLRISLTPCFASQGASSGRPSHATGGDDTGCDRGLMLGYKRQLATSTYARDRRTPAVNSLPSLRSCLCHPGPSLSLRHRRRRFQSPLPSDLLT
jgi:hypothetical protein